MSNIVTVSYTVYDESLKWAKEHCPGYITNDYHMISEDELDISYIDFFFSLDAEEDMTAFKLKWDK
jgi:hypothetical protein